MCRYRDYEHEVPQPLNPKPSVALCRYSDYEYEVPPPLNLSDLPASLSSTLQHIVGQLDVLTQVGYIDLNERELTHDRSQLRRAFQCMGTV